MCYNKEVSFVLFLYSFCIFIKLVQNPSTIDVAFYILGLSLMQLVEFFLHIYTRPKTFWHQFFSLMVPTAVILQIVLIYFYFENYYQTEDYNKNLIAKFIKFLSIIYLIMAFTFYIFILVPSFGTFDSTPLCKGPHGCKLNWSYEDKLNNFNKPLNMAHQLLYLIILLLTTYIIFGYIGASILLGLFLMAYFISGSNTFGTIWCFLVVVITTVYLILK